MSSLASWFLGKVRRRRKQNTIGEQVNQDCLNPTAENVIYQNVHIGCSIYGDDALPSTSKIQDLTGKNLPDKISSILAERREKNNDNDVEAIRETLKYLYHMITLPSLPWIEVADVPIQYYTKLELESEGDKSKKVIELRNLFDAVGKISPRRILIQSQPGFGKTTLAHKIISDWVNELEYVSRFKFAFLIVLRNFNSPTLKDEMMQIIDDENYAANELWTIINSEESLLILDGLDEVSESVRRTIAEILCDRKNKYKMTIVTTCRVGLSQLSRKEMESKFRGVSINREVWCKKITILGIDKENRNQFLGNFIDDGSKRKVMPRLLEIIDSKQEMFKSPLMLILLIYITREKRNVEIETNTAIYTQFVNYIFQRSIAKSNPENSVVNFNLFDSSFNDYSVIFSKFGKICWKHILNDELQFNFNADIEAIHQLGFLLKHETKKKFEVVVHYEGFHLSILEFAASVFLMNEFRSNQNQLCDRLIEEIIVICITKGSSSLVIPFLCGLLGNDVIPFFDQLSHYHVNYYITEGLIKCILMECKMSESTSGCLRQILPPYFTVGEPQEILAIAQPSFDTLNMDLECLLMISKPVYVRVLHCCVCRDNNFSQRKILAAKNVTCDHLIFVLSDNLSYDSVATALKSFVKIPCDQKKLYIRFRSIFDHSCSHVASCVSEGILRNAQFELHAIIFNIDVLLMSILKEVIESNQVTNLTITLHESNIILPSHFFGLFTRSIHGSISLNSLCIVNGMPTDEVSFNWDSFNEIAGDTLKSLVFCNVHVHQITHNNLCIKSLTINVDDNLLTPDHDANVLFVLTPSKLQCKWRALEVSNSDTRISFWDSVVELTVTLNERCRTYRRLVNDFTKFNNLQILTIALLENCWDKQLVTDVIESIRFLKLDELEIRWHSEDYYDDIVHEIQNLIQQNEITCAEAIRFVIEGAEHIYDTDCRFNFEPIKSAMRLNYKINFYFYFETWLYLKTFVESNITALLEFNIKFASVANNLTDSSYRHCARNDVGRLTDPNNFFYTLELMLR